MLCFRSGQIFSLTSSSCRSRLSNCFWTHSWMRWRSAEVSFSGAAEIESVGVAEEDGRGVAGEITLFATALETGVEVGRTEGVGDARSQLINPEAGDAPFFPLVFPNACS